MICLHEGAACVTSLTRPVPPDASLQSQRLTSCLETAMDKLHILALMRASGSEVPTPEACLPAWACVCHKPRPTRPKLGALSLRMASGLSFYLRRGPCCAPDARLH
jgi:hypothetical protein